MLVFVINQHSNPLMPCNSSKARRLLAAGKVKVIRRTPFTIRLLFGSTGYKQIITAGMDTGSKMVGIAAIANGKTLYQSEVKLRTDISGKMEQRAMYRRSRRSRKIRYRAPRFLNRGALIAKSRIAPSIRSKVDAHLRERKFVESILPVTLWRVETASFDIHKISNPDVVDYQAGSQKGFYNVKAYVLARDGYKCQSRQVGKHDTKLHVHHIIFRSNGGADAPSNLIVLCEKCHNKLHAGEFSIKGGRSKMKHATEAGIIQAILKRSQWDFEETFGYITKFHRENVLGLPKSHTNDAAAICCKEAEFVEASDHIYQKVCVARGDYRQTKGVRSEQRIPTGKLFGLRKFDKIQANGVIGFVKGKRSSGFFALMDIYGGIITASIDVKSYCRRLSARSSTLIEWRRVASLG